MRTAFAGLALLGFVLCHTEAKVRGQTAGEQPAKNQPKVFLGLAVEPGTDAPKHGGVVIRSVAPDSPAAKAGIKEGDVIHKVADTEVKDSDSLLGVLRRHRPGEQLTSRCFVKAKRRISASLWANS